MDNAWAGSLAVLCPGADLGFGKMARRQQEPFQRALKQPFRDTAALAGVQQQRPRVWHSAAQAVVEHHKRLRPAGPAEGHACPLLKTRNGPYTYWGPGPCMNIAPPCFPVCLYYTGEPDMGMSRTTKKNRPPRAGLSSRQDQRLTSARRSPPRRLSSGPRGPSGSL